MTSQSEELTLADIQEAITQQASLKSLKPSEGVEKFLSQQSPRVTSGTLDEYRRKLEYFLEYCEREEVEDLNDLCGREVDGFYTWRREHSTDQTRSLGQKTMRDDMYLFRSFLAYLENIEAVQSGLHEKVEIPQLARDDGVRDVELPAERASRILDYLRRYEYASREHVVWVLQCRTGRRLGGIHSLDREDFHDDTENPYLEFRHRGGTTRLKNGEQGEAEVNIPEKVADLLRDYIENNRHEVTDEDGRRPLITSPHGRLSKSTMRRYFYKWTRPCHVTGECPHGETIDECEAAQSVDAASKCESSHSPYSSRHGYLTQMRREGVPTAVISERCDVSEQVLKKHYDERSEEEKRELRREFLDEIAEDKGGYV